MRSTRTVTFYMLAVIIGLFNYADTISCDPQGEAKIDVSTPLGEFELSITASRIAYVAYSESTVFLICARTNPSMASNSANPKVS